LIVNESRGEGLMDASPKKTTLLALATAASLVGTLGGPSLASARPYHDHRYDYEDCRQRRSGNAVAGAIIGGIAGAAIGSTGHRGGGTAVGAAIGGATGAGLAAGGTHCYDHRYSDYDYYDYPPPPPPRVIYREEYYGGPYYYGPPPYEYRGGYRYDDDDDD
jgi:hypothetical protein